MKDEITQQGVSRLLPVPSLFLDGGEDPEHPELDECWASAGPDQPGWFPVAAGAGAEVPEEVLVDHVRLAPRWFRENALNPDQCDMISVTGDSMYPTLPDGCAILVDRGSVELRDGSVFVLRTAGLVVKRVRREDENDRWMLISDNPDRNFLRAAFRVDGW